MANQKLTELLEDATPLDTDLTYGVKDPTGSPSSIKWAWSTLKTFLKTYFDTLYQGVLGFTPENSANKETSALDTSTTKYPCNNVVKEAVDAKASLTGTETLTNKTLEDAKFTTSINAQTGTTYTLVLTDNSKLITLTNDGAITVTVPTNASVAFPIGTQIDLVQGGAGAVTFAGAGVIINSKGGNLTTNGQYVGVSLIKTDTNTWLLVGDLIA